MIRIRFFGPRRINSETFFGRTVHEHWIFLEDDLCFLRPLVSGSHLCVAGLACEVTPRPFPHSACLVRQRIHAHGYAWTYFAHFCVMETSDPSCCMANDVVAALVVDIDSCMFTAGFAGDDAFRAVFPSIEAGPVFLAPWSVWTWPRSSSTWAVARLKLVLLVTMQFVLFLFDWWQALHVMGDFSGRLPLVWRRLGGALGGQQLLVVEGSGTLGSLTPKCSATLSSCVPV